VSDAGAYIGTISELQRGFSDQAVKERFMRDAASRAG